MKLDTLAMDSLMQSSDQAREKLRPPAYQEAQAILTFKEALELANKTAIDLKDASDKGQMINIYA